jgi:glycyl-tRNA synthetase
VTNETRAADKFTIVNELARRRGFFWPAYEIYGGVSGFVVYGNLGARLKQNIEKKLRDLFVSKLAIIEIESPVIGPAEVFEASGHVAHFKEPMVECLNCKKRFRADHLLEEFETGQTSLGKTWNPMSRMRWQLRRAKAFSNDVQNNHRPLLGNRRLRKT